MKCALPDCAFRSMSHYHYIPPPPIVIRSPSLGLLTFLPDELSASAASGVLTLAELTSVIAACLAEPAMHSESVARRLMREFAGRQFPELPL